MLRRHRKRNSFTLMAFSNAQLAVLLSSQCCSMPEPGQPVQGHAVRGGAVQHRHRVRLKNCRITIIKVGQGHRQRGAKGGGAKVVTSTTIKATMGQQCCLQLSAHQQCCQAHSCHAPTKQCFSFFPSAFSCSFSCFALSHILNVYCNCYCCCCSLFFLLLAVNRIWQHWQRYGGGAREKSRVRQVLARSVLWPHYSAKLEQPSLLCSALLYSALLRLRLGLCI